MNKTLTYMFLQVSLYKNVCVCVCVCAHACSVNVSCVPLFATPWTVAHQAPLSTGLYRREHWNELPDPPPGDLPHPRIEPMSPAFPALASLLLSHQGCLCVCVCVLSPSVVCNSL